MVRPTTSDLAAHQRIDDVEDDREWLESAYEQQAPGLCRGSTTSDDEPGGGQRFEIGSWQYRMLREWIRAGAPYQPIGKAEATAGDDPECRKQDTPFAVA